MLKYKHNSRLDLKDNPGKIEDLDWVYHKVILEGLVLNNAR